MRKATSIAATYNPRLTHLMLLLGAVAMAAALLYGIFLLGAVAHAAGRHAAEREVNRLTSELGGLQARSLAQTRTLTLEQAKTMGYVEATRVDTLLATEASRTLSASASLRQGTSRDSF